MDKADRQKLILLGILTVLVGYFGYSGVGAFSGVSGLRVAAEKLKVERDGLSEQIQNAERMVVRLDQIRKEREALELQLRELSRRLPDERESAEVLRSVESLAGRSGLTVAQVKRQPTRSQELYVELPTEVTVGGGYMALIRFADQLAQLPRLVTLHEFRVQSRTASTPAAPTAPATAADLAPGLVGARLVAVVFQSMPSATPPSAPAPPAKP